MTSKSKARKRAIKAQQSTLSQSPSPSSTNVVNALPQIIHYIDDSEDESIYDKLDYLILIVDLIFIYCSPGQMSLKTMIHSHPAFFNALMGYSCFIVCFLVLRLMEKLRPITGQKRSYVSVMLLMTHGILGIECFHIYFLNKWISS